ncbi:hypothetical protein AAVH_40551, partial [Aphelenchoides avenae]
TQIPQETMLEVLLWLDRFDLDGKEITTRCLRSLIENKQMPLRTVARVEYDGEPRRDPMGRTGKRNTLSIRLEEGDKDGPAQVELKIETDTDAQKAALYLSSCFVSGFAVYGHREVLPKNAIIAAPPLIRQLEFLFCRFAIGNADTLNDTLNGGTFQELCLVYSSLPARQIDDKRLESFRRRGCNTIQLRQDVMHDRGKFPVTEEGILDYCFALDAVVPMPGRRSMEITSVNITPAFFKKVVEASKNSQLTCDVELCLDELHFDVGNLDLGVPPTRSSEYDRDLEAHVHHVRYNFADHGNGIRLLIHFQCDEIDDEWEVTICHGKKDHEEFFEPQP